MAGTVIITGANGSLASPTLDEILVYYLTDFQALVLTVRNTSDADVHTNKLRKKISKYPGVNISIRKLDLASLSAVHDFATTVAAEIKDGKLPPLCSIVCMAHHWNLVSGAETTEDGYEKTFQVNHLAHAALVLRLLGSFGPSGGRVVLFSGFAHWPGKHIFEKYPPAIPADLQLLVEPVAEKPSDNFWRGFQRDAVSKLVVVMWMYVLNRYLEKDPKLSNITAVAFDPGYLSDSRALRTNTPWMLGFTSRFILPRLFTFRFILPRLFTFRFILPRLWHDSRFTEKLSMWPAAEAAFDVALYMFNSRSSGYVTHCFFDNSSPDSMDETTQQKLWAQTLAWAGITQESTALDLVYDHNRLYRYKGPHLG